MCAGLNLNFINIFVNYFSRLRNALGAQCGRWKTQECARWLGRFTWCGCTWRCTWVYMAWEVQECGEVVVLLWVGVSPAEINQRVSGRLAGLQSCNCLFFANIVVIVNIIVTIIVTFVITTPSSHLSLGADRYLIICEKKSG